MEQTQETIPAINQRLLDIRLSLELNQEAFAELLSLSRSYLSNIEKGRREVPFTVVTFLIEAKGVSAHWFHTGQGEMFSPSLNPSPNPSLTESDKTKGTNSLEASSRHLTGSKTKGTNSSTKATPSKLRVLVTTVDSAGRDNITLVSTRVAAGYAQGGSIEPEFVKDLPAFSLPGTAYRNGTFRAFQVAGDSMQPTLYDGDWVVCRYVDNWARDIKDLGVHVVVTYDIPVVKRLLNQLNERGQLTLQSDNVAYPTQFLYGEEVREVWVAVARLSREFVNPRYDLMQEMSRTRADVDELLARMATIEASKGR